MFLIVLSLVIVSMFIVGCGTGQAVRAGKVAPKAQLCSNGWNKYCGYLLEGESQTYTLDSSPYTVKLDNTVYQNYPGGIHEATLIINGKKLILLEGEEQQLSDGRFITLNQIEYQDYPGGIHAASFCLR